MPSLPSIQFDAPLAVLALIPVVIGVPLVARARLGAAPGLQRGAIIGIRVALLAVLVIALAGPVLGLAQSARTVVFAIDTSNSMTPEQQSWARGWAREASRTLDEGSRSVVIEFGEHAQLGSLSANSDAPLPGATTNLEQALRLAHHVSPSEPGQERNVVLLTDGWENAGRALDAIAEGDGAGMPVSYVSFDTLGDRPPEVAVASIDVPPAVRLGDGLDIATEIQSTDPGDALVRVWVSDQLVAEQRVELDFGTNRVSLAPRIRTTGFHTVKVTVEATADTLKDNNELEAVTVAKEAGRVLLLEHQPGDGAELAAQLSQDGLQVVAQPASSVPPSPDGLAEFDSTILVNVPATSLTLDQQRTLQLYVQELGRGLLVVGGPLSYGLGGYEGTVLEEVLPVSAQPPEQPQMANVALFLIVDKSASMDISRRNEPVKLAMAKEAASQAVALLHPNDVVGVVAFDTDFEWVVPTQRIRGPEDIRAVQGRIGSIQSGGGTSILPALTTAYEAAARAEARLKHIVLLTDGQSSDRGFEELIQTMRPFQITLSTVAIGADADTKLLNTLANLGQGRYYFTERSTEVPKIASKETSILTRNAVVEGPVSAIVREPSPLLRGVPGEMPRLQGYVATTARLRAVTALETDRGDPLLAHWQYGLGRVVAWMSDSTSAGWAGEWSSSQWGATSHFWPQIVRWSMPAPRRADFSVSARVEPTGRRVVLHAESVRDDGSAADLLDTRATIVLPDGSAREVSLAQNGPGSYERTLTLEQPGIYRVLFSQHQNGQVAKEELAGFVVPRTGLEQRTVGGNWTLLRQLADRTGGQELRTPADLRTLAQGATGERYLPLWPWFVGLAALLLPLDIAIRRFRWFWRGSTQSDADVRPLVRRG